MNATDLVDAVRAEAKTELSRLGSSKTLYADTAGEMEPDAVRTTAADATHHAAEVFEGWAAEGEGDSTAVFATVGDGQRDQHAAIVADLDDYEPGDAPAAVRALETRSDSVERLGALLGWSLVAGKKAGQYTGFFTGQADPQTASTFRGFGDDHEEYREAAGSALESIADDEEDWDAAEAAAVETVEAAYDEYVETLESLGVNPKPVC